MQNGLFLAGIIISSIFLKYLLLFLSFHGQNKYQIRVSAHCRPIVALTDGIFETGAYIVPSKLQNPTVLGQGGPSSNQY